MAIKDIKFMNGECYLLKDLSISLEQYEDQMQRIEYDRIYEPYRCHKDEKGVEYIYKAMESDLGFELKSLNVDGGASQNNFLLQFEADILQASVVRPKVVEVTALGASYLAGLQVGYWKDIEDIRRNKVIERVFNPRKSILIRPVVSITLPSY